MVVEAVVSQVARLSGLRTHTNTHICGLKLDVRWYRSKTESSVFWRKSPHSHFVSKTLKNQLHWVLGASVWAWSAECVWVTLIQWSGSTKHKPTKHPCWFSEIEFANVCVWVWCASCVTGGQEYYLCWLIAVREVQVYRSTGMIWRAYIVFFFEFFKSKFFVIHVTDVMVLANQTNHSPPVLRRVEADPPFMSYRTDKFGLLWPSSNHVGTRSSGEQFSRFLK